MNFGDPTRSGDPLQCPGGATSSGDPMGSGDATHGRNRRRRTAQLSATRPLETKRLQCATHSVDNPPCRHVLGDTAGRSSKRVASPAPTSGLVLPHAEGRRPSWAKPWGQNGPSLGLRWPHARWPTSATICQARGLICGRTLPRVGHPWPTLGPNRPMLAEAEPNLGPRSNSSTTVRPATAAQTNCAIAVLDSSAGIPEART